MRHLPFTIYHLPFFMYNLVQLFLKFSGFLTFLLLEIICFTLVVKYNQKQQTVYISSVNRLTGWLDKKQATVNQYFSLDEANAILAAENAHLLEQLSNIEMDSSRIDSVLSDTNQLKYTFLSAKVLSNSINRHHNYLELDKGSMDGVRENSAVVTSEGVVGIVRKVSRNYSVAMSILHREMNVSARIKGKFYFGNLVWKSMDNRLFNLEDIPKHAPIMKGDTVETSGYSAIFPDGIFLGTVEKLWMDPGSNFYTIEVRSKLDMSNLRYASIVHGIFKQEREQLEQSVLEEDE